MHQEDSFARSLTVKLLEEMFASIDFINSLQNNEQIEKEKDKRDN